MPRDLPDWHAQNAQTTIGEVTDLGELAVRLGSIDTFDRRGDVVFLEDFEAGHVHCSLTTSGSGAVADLSAAEARSGLFSVRLVGGSSGGRFAAVIRRAAPQVLAGLGLEVAVRIPGTIEHVQFQILVYTGSNLLTFDLRWRDAENDLQYRDSGGTWVTFATSVDLSTAAALFHMMKMGIDAANTNFAFLVLDNTTYSLAGIAGQSEVNAALPVVDVAVVCGSRSGQNDTIYVDDLIFTQNEPV